MIKRLLVVWIAICGLLFAQQSKAYWQSIQQVAIAGGGGGNAFSLIANVAGSDSGGNTIVTSSVNSTGANLIVGCASQYSGNAAGTLSDNKGNTYTGKTAQTSGDSYNRLWFIAGSFTVGTGHTFTYSNGGQPFGSIQIQAWSGANTSPFDVESGSNSGGGVGTSRATGSVTPTNSNSLIVACIGTVTGQSGTHAIGSGYTVSDNVSTAAFIEGGASAYLKQNTAAASNPTWTWTGSTFSSATIAVFKP